MISRRISSCGLPGNPGSVHGKSVNKPGLFQSGYPFFLFGGWKNGSQHSTEYQYMSGAESDKTLDIYWWIFSSCLMVECVLYVAYK